MAPRAVGWGGHGTWRQGRCGEEGMNVAPRAVGWGGRHARGGWKKVEGDGRWAWATSCIIVRRCACGGRASVDLYRRSYLTRGTRGRAGKARGTRGRAGKEPVTWHHGRRAGSTATWRQVRCAGGAGKSCNAYREPGQSSNKMAIDDGSSDAPRKRTMFGWRRSERIWAGRGKKGTHAGEDERRPSREGAHVEINVEITWRSPTCISPKKASRSTADMCPWTICLTATSLRRHRPA